ncbi:MAG TPA: V-type ATP synthase subunit E family protein [Methanocorpusculum sp.]|nr:V-type ATP synthase subunit E family protein [Methanocorpusculum sp.]HJJ54724.1 V-type ATP synthase subunit E family protein [Methanocorpusculum sp.]
MGLEVVVDEIKAKGDAEAAKIIADANAEAVVIKADAQKRADEIKAAAEKEAAAQSERMLVRETASANLIVKREELNAQKALLDKVYAAAQEEIANLPADTHAKAVKALIKEAAGQMAAGEVFCNARDESAAKDAIGELSGFSFGGIKDIDGGVIVQSTDGQLTLDYSYKTFMAEVWESSMKDTSEILFG